MIKYLKTLTVFIFVMGLSVGAACAEKWLGGAIFCQNYEDTTSMALESNLASSELAAMKVYMKYISNGKCMLHKNCVKVIYEGRGSKEFFDMLRKEDKSELIEIAKMFPISGIKLSKDGQTYYVQDDYLVMTESRCK